MKIFPANSQQSYEVVTLTAIDGKINIQEEIDIFFKHETICFIRKNVLIELVSIPKGIFFFNCTSKSNVIHNH